MKLSQRVKKTVYHLASPSSKSSIVGTTDPKYKSISWRFYLRSHRYPRELSAELGKRPNSWNSRHLLMAAARNIAVLNRTEIAKNNESDSYSALVISFTSLIRELKALVLLRSPGMLYNVVYCIQKFILLQIHLRNMRISSSSSINRFPHWKKKLQVFNNALKKTKYLFRRLW